MTCKLHAAAIAIDDVLPSGMDTTWQREGTVAVSIGLMLDLRDALREPFGHEVPSVAAFTWDEDIRKTAPVQDIDCIFGARP